MMLSSLTRENLMNHVRAVLLRRPDFGFVRREGFQDGFVHGLSIIAGIGLGFGIFLMFQTPPAPLPPEATYHVTTSFATKGAQKAAEGSEAAAEPTTHDEHPDEHAQVDAAHSNDPHAETATVAQNEAHGPEPKGDNAPGKVEIPAPGLTEHDATYGDLPIIRKSDGMRPFDIYRQQFPADQLNKPLIAVVMLDYGLSTQLSGSILGVMPPEVNVVLSPAASDGANWSHQAFDNGHELWLELAIEPPNYPESDPGALALLTASPLDKNQSNLKAQMGHAVGYAGLFARTPSPFLSTGAPADFLSGATFNRGLGLVLNSDTVDGIFHTEAVRQKAPYFAGAMITLDDTKNTDYMAAMTEQAEATATKNGFAIALFHPTQFSQKNVLAWLSTLKGKGYVLAPLSVIAERGVDLVK